MKFVSSRRLLVCVAALHSKNIISAFQPSISLLFSARVSLTLPVIIYDGDDYVEEENSSQYIYRHDSWASPPLVHLLERLSAPMETLARVAAAFAPSSHLKLKNLSSVEVVAMDSNHMELAAVICDDQECLQVPVPVLFPVACGDSDNMEECVLNNLNLLDSQAQHLIFQEEWNEEHMEELEDQHRISRILSELGHFDVPYWWILPPIGLMEECNSIKQLLNEDDFAAELLALAKQWILMERREVTQACVSAVGPSGMILRGKVMDHDSWDIVEIPIRFYQQASSAEDLRDSVVGLVSSLA